MLAKKFAFGFGIAIVLPLLVHYGVSTFSPRPDWSLHYDTAYSYQAYENATPEERTRIEREREERAETYRKTRKRFERHLFYTAVPVGLAAIVIGAYLAVQSIGAGLIFGGIFTMIDGYCWYWSELPDGMRFISLLVAFFVLIMMGYSKLSVEKKGEPHA